MKHKAYTRFGMVIALIIAVCLGIIAFIQYQIAKTDSVIITTISNAQQVAKKVTAHVKDGNNSEVQLSQLVDLKEKGWALSENNQSYEYKQDGKVVASVHLDHEKGSVVYKINCGSLINEFSQQECSDALDGTGKNYVSTDDVPW